jgi:hypothetical protein
VLGTFANPVMRDGSPIFTGQFKCSLGFNVYPVGRRNLHYFITAGHCTHLGSTWHADPSLSRFLGVNSGSPGTYGPGGDFGMVNYQGVNINVLGTVAGTNLNVTGWGPTVVGQAIQRSGDTTGVRGGTVTALDATVNYVDGTTINGLIRTTACAQPGDSGGPMYKLTIPAGSAEGLGVLSGGSGNCSIGGTTFYQPISPIMINFALQMWD